MTPVIYHLRDRGEAQVTAWKRYFAEVVEVKPAVGDIFGEPVDAVVSPANCFGFMNGGIDKVYTQRFSKRIERKLRAILASDWDGELPIGLAVLVETDDRYARTLRILSRMGECLHDANWIMKATEINEIKYLFRATQPWTVDDAKAFVLAARRRIEA